MTPTHPGSADVLRKALVEILARHVARCGEHYAEAVREGLTEKIWIDDALAAMAEAHALSADAALSQPQDQLRDISRALRDNMVLDDSQLSQSRLHGSFDRQLWNDWAEAIGDLAVPDAALSQQGVVDIPDRVVRFVADFDNGHDLFTRFDLKPVRDYIAEQKPVILTFQERIAGSGRDAVADDLLTPQEAWQNLMDKDDRNSPAEYQDMCLITAKELADYMRRASADVPQAQVTTDDILIAGNAFRDTLVSRADSMNGAAPLWHGWAIMDAFIAGAEYLRCAITSKSAEIKKGAL